VSQMPPKDFPAFLQGAAFPPFPESLTRVGFSLEEIKDKLPTVGPLLTLVPAFLVLEEFLFLA